MLGLGLDGEVWSWGKGDYGRLGNGGAQSQQAPEPVEPAKTAGMSRRHTSSLTTRL